MRNRRRIVLMGSIGDFMPDFFPGLGGADVASSGSSGASDGTDAAALANAQAQSNADLLARQADVNAQNAIAASWGVTVPEIHQGQGATVTPNTNTAPALSSPSSPKSSSAAALATLGVLGVAAFWVAKKKHLLGL